MKSSILSKRKKLIVDTRNFLKSTPFVIFILFSLSIFLKVILFNEYTLDIDFSKFKNISRIIFYFCGKLFIAGGIASFVFLFKRYTWTFVASFLLDFWCTGNYIYYKCNDLLVSWDVIKMANQLHGFESSILSSIDLRTCSFLLISAIYAILCLIATKKLKFPYLSRKNAIFAFVATFLVSFFILMPMSHGTKTHAIIRNRAQFNEKTSIVQKSALYMVPFYTIYAELNLTSSGMRAFNSSDYITKENIITYMPAMVFASLFKEENIKLTSNDINDPYFQSAFNKNTTPVKATKNLIVIMMESFESWVLDNSHKFGNSMPNFSKFIQGDHILYASKVKSQAKYGVSGDGQMLVNSGLLPISEKAACIAYGSNKYPGLGELYENSALINPCPTNVWNQRQMTRNYGYKKQIQTNEEEDREVFKTLVNHIDTVKSPFITMGISIDTHLPFEKYSNTQVDLPRNTPKIISNYIKSFAHTDSTFGIFLEKFNHDSLLQNSTIVIVGDHTILKNDNLNELRKFATENQLDFDGNNYVPLIIYDSDIQGNQHINEIVYQMDIFPTILHLLNSESYYFKGFGVNILDSNARYSRYYTEDKAYEISEKMITSNHFSKLVQ